MRIKPFDLRFGQFLIMRIAMGSRKLLWRPIKDYFLYFEICLFKEKELIHMHYETLTWLDVTWNKEATFVLLVLWI